MIPKRELVRVARSPEGKVSIDPTGKSPGRGAYLCGKIDCFAAAKKRRALDRALNVEIPDEIYDRLESDWIEMKNVEKS